MSRDQYSSSRITLHPAIYMTIVGILFPCLAVVYLHNCSGRATHSIPEYIAPEPQSIAEPYECCSDGSLDYCAKDDCNMRWKPPGTHHCSTCRVCRVGFDHHCPWVSEVPAASNPRYHLSISLSYQLGNCVTTGRLKAFLSLLVLTSVTVPLASLPLLPPLRKHVVAALAASHADAWTTNIWWSRPYSWIVCGGPAGRWVVGTLLGFRVLRGQRIPETSWFKGSLVAQPHARVVILVSAAALLWLFAVVRIFSFIARNLQFILPASFVVVHDTRRRHRCDQRSEPCGQCSLPSAPTRKDNPKPQPLCVHPVSRPISVPCIHLCCRWYSHSAREWSCTSQYPTHLSNPSRGTHL